MKFLSFLLLIVSVVARGQDMVPLFNTKVEVRYAMLSPDGKNLVVATAGDSIIVKDAVSLVTKKVRPAFTSTSPISKAYTGKKIFHITDDNNLVYVTRNTSATSVNIILKSEALETGKLNYEVPLGNINKEDFESEKLYNRLSYGVSVSGGTLLYFLNDIILTFEVATGKVTNTITGDHSVSAALSADKKFLAIATPDSIKQKDLVSGKIVWRSNVKADGVHFLGDLLVAFGDGIRIFDVKTGKENSQLYYSRGVVYGLEESRDKKHFTFSISDFSDHGFAATIDRESLLFASVFHLPKTEGYTSLFHPVTNQHWIVTTNGQLHRFNYNDNPKPISQAGHHNSIKSFTFSRDQRSLLTASNGGEIIIWDIPTTRVKERFNTNITWMENVVFDDNDQNLFSISNIALNKIHRDIPTNADALTHNVFFDPKDSAYVKSHVNRMADEKERSMQLARKFEIDETKPMAISALYLVGEADLKLRVANLKTNAVTDFPIPDNLNGLEQLAFYKPNIVVTEGIYNTIVFVDVTTGNVIKRLGKQRNTYAPRIDQLVFNETADTLAAVSNDHVQLWDLRKGENIIDLNLGKRASQNGALSLRKGKLTFITENNNNYFATVANIKRGSVQMIIYADTAFHQQADLVDLHVIRAPGYPTKLKLSNDGRSLLILRFAENNGVKETFVDWWDLVTMKLNRTFAASGLEFPCWEVSWDNQKIAVWDFNEASRLRIFDMASGKVSEIGLGKLNVKLIGETSVRFINESELWVLDTYDNTLVRVDLKKKAVKGKFDLTGYGHYERVGKLFSPTNNSFIYAVHPFQDGYINQFRKWDIGSNSVVAESTSNSTPITSFSEAHSSGVFAIGLADNTISVRNTSDLKERFHIVQDDDRHYAFMTPENYYKADRTSAAALQFSWRDKSFALHQFDTWFNRPDKVLAATGHSRPADIDLLQKAFEKRTKKYSNESLTDVLKKVIPAVSISNIDAIPLQTLQDSVKVDVRIAAHTNHISTLIASVNGVPVKKVSFSKTNQPQKQALHSLYIPLTSGKNKISITVEDTEEVLSVSDEVVVELTKKRPRDLYVFTVAISNYKNPDLKLNYAVKDGRDIANFFSKDKRFDRVIVDSLFNSNVTTENVGKIRTKLRNAKADDMVIIFLAGHGLLDENLDFRFATWALDLANPGKTSILYEDLEKLLDGVKPINKILLIDACHSGSVDKTEVLETVEKMIQERFGDNRAAVKQQTFEKIKHNVFNSGVIDRTSFEMMQDIFIADGSKTGAQVIVATAGDSFAIESADWQNGFFTYSLLSGMKTGSADLDNDGSITVDEIIVHLKQEVKRMSAGKQLPRLREENTENYFEVWRN